MTATCIAHRLVWLLVTFGLQTTNFWFHSINIVDVIWHPSFHQSCSRFTVRWRRCTILQSLIRAMGLVGRTASIANHYMLRRLKVRLNDRTRMMSIAHGKPIHAIKITPPSHSPTILHPEVAIKQCIAKTLACSPWYKYLSPPRLIQSPFFFPHASGSYHQASVPAAHEWHTYIAHCTSLVAATDEGRNIFYLTCRLCRRHLAQTFFISLAVTSTARWRSSSFLRLSVMPCPIIFRQSNAFNVA